MTIKSNPVAEPIDHDYFMQQALQEAQKAWDLEEVPIGAVIVYQNSIIGRGFNQRESLQDPISHAEIIAIRQAAAQLKRWRLEQTIMYVTLEPCAMCAGAMVLARMKQLVFALRDPKSGACGSIWNIVTEPRLNHHLEVVEGICVPEARQLLQSFFKAQRKKPKYRKKAANANNSCSD